MDMDGKFHIHGKSDGGTLGARALQELTLLFKIVSKCTKTRHFHIKKIRQFSAEAAQPPNPFPVGRGPPSHVPPLNN